MHYEVKIGGNIHTLPFDIVRNNSMQIQFFTLPAKISPSCISKFKQMKTKTEARVEDELRVPQVLLAIAITWLGLLPENHEGWLI